MFLLELPPISQKQVPLQVAQGPKPKTAEPQKPATAPSGGKDEFKTDVSQTHKAIQDIELKLKTEKDPNARKDLTIELIHQKLRLAIENKAVTEKDIETFLKANPLDQPVTKAGNDKYKLYVNTVFEAYETITDKKDTEKLSKLNSFKGIIKDQIKYREQVLQNLEDQQRRIKDLSDIAFGR